MAKVKKEMIEAGILTLFDKISKTMPNSTYKFLLGGAAGLMSVSGIQQLKRTIDSIADQNGLVDTTQIKTVYESAFKASDNKLQIELFGKQDSILSLFVKPVIVTITKEDIDGIMADIESNAAVNEVQLAK